MKISAVKIELLLARKNMTNKKLAEKSGVCRQNISTIKKRGTCTPASLAKLAKALEVDPADLIEEVKE